MNKTRQQQRTKLDGTVCFVSFRQYIGLIGRSWQLFQDTDYKNILMSVREVNMLNALVYILEPFAKATDTAKGDSSTISYVVPSVVGLYTFLNPTFQTCQYHVKLPHQLKSSLESNFELR